MLQAVDVYSIITYNIFFLKDHLVDGGGSGSWLLGFLLVL